MKKFFLQRRRQASFPLASCCVFAPYTRAELNNQPTRSLNLNIQSHKRIAGSLPCVCFATSRKRTLRNLRPKSPSAPGARKKTGTTTTAFSTTAVSESPVTAEGCGRALNNREHPPRGKPRGRWSPPKLSPLAKANSPRRSLTVYKRAPAPLFRHPPCSYLYESHLSSWSLHAASICALKNIVEPNLALLFSSPCGAS